MSTTPVIVFGEGSAAVFLIQKLVQKGEQIIWAAGSGARLLPVMPSVNSELALATLLDAQKGLTDEVYANPIEMGIFHRVFRNKAFKLPSWKRTSDVVAQKQAFAELVWDPEQAYLGVQEHRIAGVSPADIETRLRELLKNHPQITPVSAAPIVELEILEKGGKIQFANGFITEFKQFYFCDSLNELKAIPKLLTVLKHQMGNVKSSKMMSALQVVFTHREPLNQAIETGLVIPLNRDAGDAFDRDALGYFLEPLKSVWTVFLRPEEIEENHEIMKKLRKMKQALNRAFDGPDFLPAGTKEFTDTVQSEQVHFEEAFIAVEGSFKESKANRDFVLLTDAFGLTAALEQIAVQFELEAVGYGQAEALPHDQAAVAPSVSL